MKRWKTFRMIWNDTGRPIWQRRLETQQETLTKQRSQLETLLGFSRNLRAQNDHLKERQEPLRKLVYRLNMQEKALVRYVRMNYDREFIPSLAYGG